MPYSDPSLGSNVSLLDNGETEERKYGDRYGRRSGQAKRTLLFVVSLCAVVFISLVIGFAGGHYFKITDKRATNESHNSAQVCQDPILRREWRSLSRSQKNDYIQAVKCLKTVPSQLQLNQTLYDDFAWVHKNVGEYSHDAAPFLAWHRYFIHTYEQKLQECGYQGHLTYWDWTLDWENITRSPVWDVQTGFGGSGNTSAGPPVFKAYCMTEGPFAHLEVPYFEHIYQPHCLLRGFDDHLEDYRVELQPKALMRLLLSPNYTALNLGLEHGPHISIPKSVNGDFSLHTAPYDPVFFLHHTQLDRIWWQWQQANYAERATEYLGKASTDAIDQASLTDMLPMGGLLPDVEVLEIMSTKSELLCYRY